MNYNIKDKCSNSKNDLIYKIKINQRLKSNFAAELDLVISTPAPHLLLTDSTDCIYERLTPNSCQKFQSLLDTDFMHRVRTIQLYQPN